MASSAAASIAKRSFPFIALFSLLYILLTNRRTLPSSPSSSSSSSSSPPAIDDDPDLDAQVEFDFAPFLRRYRSGRVERRTGTAVVPASPVGGGGAASSFDVVLDPLTGLAARLYFPVVLPGAGDGGPEPKLPILVYLHGGAFVVESAFSPTYHRYLELLVARARIVAVSVDYRLAPEHPLPAAYDDAWAALRWAAANARPGKLLARLGDPARIFLAGDSAGANIAHNAALRAGSEDGVRVAGLVLQNPYFWGKEPVAGETRDAGERGRMESTWGFVCGGAYGIDHPYVNPMGGSGSGDGEWGRRMGCGRVMVTVAEDDVFRARGVAYAEGLRRSGFAGEVELYETRGEWHAYFLSKLGSANAVKEIDAVVAFINRP